MTFWYTLDKNHNPIASDGPDYDSDRRVARDEIGEATVSTVFLTLDHNFGDGPPVLFETLVFGGPLDQEMRRYCTWDEAVSGHARMVARVREAMTLGLTVEPEESHD